MKQLNRKHTNYSIAMQSVSVLSCMHWKVAFVLKALPPQSEYISNSRWLPDHAVSLWLQLKSMWRPSPANPGHSKMAATPGGLL